MHCNTPTTTPPSSGSTDQLILRLAHPLLHLHGFLLALLFTALALLLFLYKGRRPYALDGDGLLQGLELVDDLGEG